MPLDTTFRRLPTRSRAARAASVALLLLGATSVGATDAEPSAPHLDACRGCHVEAAAGGSVPLLEGQPQRYLASQLTAFREGRRRSELMQAVAAQLGDDEIAALARWWSTQPRESPAASGRRGVVSLRLLTRMRFPAAFPSGFQVYERLDDVANGTVRLSYANAAAWQAAREGRALPDGSVIIVATHAATRVATGADPSDAGAATRTAGRADTVRLVPGAVLAYAGMEARVGWGQALPALLRNEDWNYALFDAERRTRATANQAECLACHRPRAADSFVFGLATLRAAARRQP
jgi:cytochrome c553